MCLKNFRPLHRNISKVTVNKVVLDSQRPCTVQHWTDLLSVCFCKSAPLLSPSLLSLIGLSQGYPEVSYCHMASQRPTDVMLLLHNLWRLLFLQMRCTISLSRWVPRLRLSPVISLNQNKPFITTVDFSARRCSKKTTKNNLQPYHSDSLTSAADRRSRCICSATIKRAFITGRFGTHWEFKMRC